MLCSTSSEAPAGERAESDALRAALSSQPLLSDLYQFTMAQGYWLRAPQKRASFNYFVRRAPFDAQYFVVAGIEPLLEALERLTFSSEDIEFLRSIGSFRPEFLAALREFRFRGDVHSIAEGTPAFAGTPLLRIEGSMLETELVTGLVLSHLNYQTVVATKAARIVDAAVGTPIVELGVRRAHGLAGSAYGSRAAHIGGVALTSNVLAGKLFGIPVAGTMAHSWVMSFASELEAFATYAELYPEQCTLLVDTYGAQQGLKVAIPVLQDLARRGVKQLGIRTDSGDPNLIVPELRRTLNEHGLGQVRVVLSGDLDEAKIHELVRTGARADVFGVGSRLLTAQDDPALSGVYKLAAWGEGSTLTPCMKRSDTPEKASLPGAVNVVRFRDAAGYLLSDLVVQEEQLAGNASTEALKQLAARGSVADARSAEVLLRPAIRQGARLHPALHASSLQERARAERSKLPAHNEASARARVQLSDPLRRQMAALSEVRFDRAAQ